jgi:acyl carrier protein
MWDDEFERLVRAQVTLPPEEPLPPDAELVDLGLDSMRTVTILVEVEQAYGVTFTDDLLMPATFATARTLWTALIGLAPTRVGQR